MARTTRTQRRMASARKADAAAHERAPTKAELTKLARAHIKAGTTPGVCTPERVAYFALIRAKAKRDVAHRVAVSAQTGTKMLAAKQAKADAKRKGLTPEGYAAAGTEHAHQVAVFMWAAQEAPKEWRSALQFMFAIPNGGERNKAVAARLKAEGVKSGVPDIMLPVRKGRYAGLFIELKKPRAGKVRGGKATLEQNAWITVLNGLGYSAHVCEGCLAAIAVITVYMGLGPFETMADMGTN